ncbi:MAG: ribonuclease D, partial [Nitrospiraceae bacterium]
MTPPRTHYIADPNSLKMFCERIRGADRLALDTEFVGEDTFVPRLELIQLAAGDLAAVIDVPAVGPLDCVMEVLSDPSTEKVVHAGRQDLELLLSHGGRVPTPVFDTQVAAAMVGYGTQMAYAHLVQRVL